MKKLFIILFLIPLFANSQTPSLDTVIVRNLQLQAQDWAWFVGKYASTTDSVSVSTIRKIRVKIQSNIPQSWTTNVTVDSLPGRVVIAMYQELNNSPASEIADRYSSIKAAISAKTNLAYWIGFIDAQGPAEFNRKRNIGKNVLIDN